MHTDKSLKDHVSVDLRSGAEDLDPHIIRKRGADDVLEKFIEHAAPHIITGAELKKIAPEKSCGQNGVFDNCIRSVFLDPHPGAAVHKKTIVDLVVGAAAQYADLIAAASQVKIFELQP